MLDRTQSGQEGRVEGEKRNRGEALEYTIGKKLLCKPLQMYSLSKLYRHGNQGEKERGGRQLSPSGLK